MPGERVQTLIVGGGQAGLMMSAQLRRRGLNTELYHQPDKLAKQLRYAARKEIPFVWFPPFSEGNPHEVKDLTTGEQTTADPDTWLPPGTAAFISGTLGDAG